MTEIEKELQTLMRQINKDGRSVSWGRSNYLYSHPYNGGFPRIEWSATIFKKDSCRIDQMFESINCESLYRCVSEWAQEKGIIEKTQEEPIPMAACGNPF